MERDFKIIIYSFVLYLATGIVFFVTDKVFLVYLPILPIIIFLVTAYFFIVSIQKELIPAVFLISNSIGIVSLLFLNIFNSTFSYLVILSLLSISMSGVFLATITKEFTSAILGMLFSSVWLYIFENIIFDFLTVGVVFFSSIVFYKKFKHKLRSSQIRLLLQVGLISGLLLITLISTFIIEHT